MIFTALISQVIRAETKLAESPSMITVMEHMWRELSVQKVTMVSVLAVLTGM
jgi:hypothetical protein